MAKNQPTKTSTKGEVEDAMKTLKRKKCKDVSGWNNEMIVDEGEEMEKSVLKLINRIEVERTVPEEWKEVLIKAVGKPGGGSVLEMDNKRGLFMTEVLSKLYEKVMKKRNDGHVEDYVSPCQTGGTK